MIDLTTTTTLRRRAETECPNLLAETDRLHDTYQAASRAWAELWAVGSPEAERLLSACLDARLAYIAAARRLGAALR